MLLVRRRPPSYRTCDPFSSWKRPRSGCGACSPRWGRRGHASAKPRCPFHLSSQRGQSSSVLSIVGHPSTVVYGPAIGPRGFLRPSCGEPSAHCPPTLGRRQTPPGSAPAPRTTSPIATPPWRVPANGLPTSQCDETSMHCETTPLVTPLVTTKFPCIDYDLSNKACFVLRGLLPPL